MAVQTVTKNIIVNNAVIQYEWKHVLHQSPADYRSQFESCVLHNVLMAQAFVPAMIRRRRGDVFNMGSIAGLQSYPGGAAYCAAKFGVTGLTEVMRASDEATKAVRAKLRNGSSH
jgi:3-oxoacyl-[acyl-carrier protein] reductase